MKRWLAEISWRWYFWICPNNSKGQEEEHSCNRDHPNWYLRHLINDSINIISTSQMLEAPATTAPTADGIESLPGSRPTRQAEQKICWNYSTNIITTSQRSDQLVTTKHHQRQYQPASSNHYNSNPTHERNTFMNDNTTWMLAYFIKKIVNIYRQSPIFSLITRNIF